MYSYGYGYGYGYGYEPASWRLRYSTVPYLHKYLRVCKLEITF